jgi:hypothetical protein
MPEHIRGSAQRMVKNKLNNIWNNKIIVISLWSKQKEIMKVINSRITEQPKSFWDPESNFGPMPKVYVTLENGVEEFLFEYYPDEISFTPSEFIGLTIDECRHLKFKKDKTYLTT